MARTPQNGQESPCRGCVPGRSIAPASELPLRALATGSWRNPRCTRRDGFADPVASDAVWTGAGRWTGGGDPAALSIQRAMSHSRIQSRPRACVALLLALVAPLFASCASIPDDADPALVRRAGDRAKIVIDERPFSSSEGTYGYTVTGPDGKAQTTTIQVFANGFGWNANEAGKLEAYFTEAMVESGAFAVIDRSVLRDRQVDAAFAKELEADQDPTKVLRPDLKLVCSLTRLEPNAEVKGSNFFATSWLWLGGKFAYGWYSLLGGGLQNMSRKAECQIKVKIVDCRSGETIATAEGNGHSVGTSSRTRGAGWGIGGGLSFGTESAKDANLSMAIERAAIRAVNNLIEKIPAQYFHHAR